MRASLALQLRASRALRSRAPLLRIKDATFYRRQPSPNPSEEEKLSNPPLFADLDFLLPSDLQAAQHWAIIGPSNAGKTTLLEILQGQHLCFPPTARSYPYLSSDEIRKKDSSLSYPARAVRYVGFSSKERGLSGIGSHLSARYESRREETDFSVQDFLTGNMDLNPDVNGRADPPQDAFDKIVSDLQLQKLLNMPVSNLSNGQTRRARIAKALLDRPELLLLDEPFSMSEHEQATCYCVLTCAIVGLDPPTTVKLNPILRNLAASASPRVVLSLRTQDPIPDWITHVAFLGKDLRITHRGPKSDVDNVLFADEKLRKSNKGVELKELPQNFAEYGRTLTDVGIIPRPNSLKPVRRARLLKSQEAFEQGARDDTTLRNVGVGEVFEQRDQGILFRYPKWRYHIVSGESLIEMAGVNVSYGDHKVLGDWPRQEYLTDRDGDLQPKQDPDHRQGLHWTVRRGERWAVAGPNGSGKTTLLALILSDHPQSYSQPVRLFGRSRLPTQGQPGLSLFDLQRRIGHSSPEVHAFFPRHLTVRATLESAFADTPLSPVSVDEEAGDRIVAFLRWFQGELNPAKGQDETLEKETLAFAKTTQPPLENTNTAAYRRELAEMRWTAWNDVKESTEWSYDMKFSDLTFTGQRVALFLRAIVARPDIVVLDEAFSGLDDAVREKCKLFLEHGELARLSPYYSRNTYGYSGHRIPQFRTIREIAPLDIHFKGLTSDQALIVVSHVKEEVPLQVRHLLYLPESGSGEACKICDVGTHRPLYLDPGTWGTIWGMARTPVHTWLQYGQFYPDEARANHERQAVMKSASVRVMSGGELQLYEARPDLRSRKEPWRLRMSAPKGGRPVGARDSYKRVNTFYEATKAERMEAKKRKEAAAEARKEVRAADRLKRLERRMQEEEARQVKQDAKRVLRLERDLQASAAHEEAAAQLEVKRQELRDEQKARRVEWRNHMQARREHYEQQIELAKAQHRRTMAQSASPTVKSPVGASPPGASPTEASPTRSPPP